MTPVVIHNIEQAKEVIAYAHENGLPLTLQSAHGAPEFVGLGYLNAMWEQIQAAFPGIRTPFIIDCADNGALAVEAIRIGFTHIRFSGNAAIAEKLESMAKKSGIKLYLAEVETLDILDEPISRLQNRSS
jgi:fructose/tagatose bisphosphate aldolase